MRGRHRQSELGPLVARSEAARERFVASFALVRLERIDLVVQGQPQRNTITFWQLMFAHWYPWAGLIRAQALPNGRYFVVEGSDRVVAARELGWPSVYLAVADDGASAAEDRLVSLLPYTEVLQALALSVLSGRDVTAAAHAFCFPNLAVHRAQRLLDLYDAQLLVCAETQSDVAVLETLAAISNRKARHAMAMQALKSGWTRGGARTFVAAARREDRALALGVEPLLDAPAVAPQIENLLSLQALDLEAVSLSSDAAAELANRRLLLGTDGITRLSQWQDDLATWFRQRYRSVLTRRTTVALPPPKASVIYRRSRQVARATRRRGGTFQFRCGDHRPTGPGWQGRLMNVGDYQNRLHTEWSSQAGTVDDAVRWWMDVLAGMEPWAGIVTDEPGRAPEWRRAARSLPFRLEAARRLGWSRVWRTTSYDRRQWTLPPVPRGRLAAAICRAFDIDAQPDLSPEQFNAWGLSSFDLFCAMGVWRPSTQRRLLGLARFDADVRQAIFQSDSLVRPLSRLAQLRDQPGPGFPDVLTLINGVARRLLSESWLQTAGDRFVCSIARAYDDLCTIPASRIDDRITPFAARLAACADPTLDPEHVVLALCWAPPVLTLASIPVPTIARLREVRRFYIELGSARLDRRATILAEARQAGRSRNWVRRRRKPDPAPTSAELLVAQMANSGASMRAMATVTGRSLDWVRARINRARTAAGAAEGPASQRFPDQTWLRPADL